MAEQKNFCDKTAVLFDLDGTVIDSKEGIFNALKYMFEKISMDFGDEERLMKFIGPSIASALRTEYNFNDDDANAAVAIYREYYSVKGYLECDKYDGIEELLKKLVASGKKVGLATKKPEEYAKKIIDNLGLNCYFGVVCGSSPQETNNSKSHIIKNAMEALCAKTEDTVMIGDSKYDVIGANEAEVESIGVLYGYGSGEEMLEHGVNVIARDMTELSKLLVNP